MNCIQNSDNKTIDYGEVKKISQWFMTLRLPGWWKDKFQKLNIQMHISFIYKGYCVWRTLLCGDMEMMQTA